MKASEIYHDPVLLKESLALLDLKPEGIYVDATFGGGGHSREILSSLKTGKLIAFDKDRDAEQNKLPETNFELIRSDFCNLASALKERGVSRVDGILADLGVSSHQFNTAGRGFSFRYPVSLDMRMDIGQERDAIEVLNEYTFEELAHIFRHYGEINNPGKLSAHIVKAREIEPIKTTVRLHEVVQPCMPVRHAKKYLAKLYQAIRIEVNRELESLEALLLQAVEVLAPGGRIAVISYHSLEDRKVKSFFRYGNFEGDAKKDFYGNPLTPWKIITKRPIVPREEEIEKNPRARSAKLRVAEKL